MQNKYSLNSINNSLYYRINKYMNLSRPRIIWNSWQPTQTPKV